MNTNNDVTTPAPTASPPVAKAVIRGHHHFFTIAAADLSGCIQACKERGLRFVDAKRNGYYVPPQKTPTDADDAADFSAGHTHPAPRYVAIDDSKVEGCKSGGFRPARPEMEKCFVNFFSWDVKAAESKEQNAARLKAEADAEAQRQVEAIAAMVEQPLTVKIENEIFDVVQE